MNRFLILSILFFTWSALVVGNTDSDGLEPVPDSPELPDTLRSGENIEPRVKIIRKDDTVIKEYRFNGFLYMVKITPAFGLPYYLIDQDGDGRLESRMSDLDDVVVPQWVLFSW